MLEQQIILAAFALIGCLIDIVICLWEHDTNALFPWVIAFFGWFVAFCQLMIRFNKENGYALDNR